MSKYLQVGNYFYKFKNDIINNTRHIVVDNEVNPYFQKTKYNLEPREIIKVYTKHDCDIMSNFHYILIVETKNYNNLIQFSRDVKIQFSAFNNDRIISNIDIFKIEIIDNFKYKLHIQSSLLSNPLLTVSWRAYYFTLLYKDDITNIPLKINKISTGCQIIYLDAEPRRCLHQSHVYGILGIFTPFGFVKYMDKEKFYNTVKFTNDIKFRNIFDTIIDTTKYKIIIIIISSLKIPADVIRLLKVMLFG